MLEAVVAAVALVIAAARALAATTMLRPKSGAANAARSSAALLLTSASVCAMVASRHLIPYLRTSMRFLNGGIPTVKSTSQGKQQIAVSLFSPRQDCL